MRRLSLAVDLEDWEKRTKFSQKKLIRWVQKILHHLGWEKVRCSLVLVNDSQMRRLHARFLGKDRTTDVLAFRQMEATSFPHKGLPFLGDVAVSIETAKRVGPSFGNRWDEELLLYICHGILHLMGYQDSTSRAKAKMEKKQETILKEVLRRRWRSKRPKPLF